MAELENVFGQVDVAAFNEGARAGTIRYERGAAEQAARMYDEMVAKLAPIKKGLEQVASQDGFGGFDSGRALQKGFSSKAIGGADVIEQAIATALGLKAAYLRAGGLIEEADEANRVMIARAGAALENGSSNP
ncbi:hypothetical protein ACFWUP_30595 [Nocardia sp. NPDC058658]|uniref:hypothetical protein n=1 Tax=Nocardia sp. NPDC058658 TaxID=3346580 RepID=UPI003664BAF6